MKEIYYKLNREKLETKLNAALFETLLEIDILEEVQEEEIYSNSGNTPEEEKYSSHLFKAMTEWHLMEYISRNSSSKYVDKELIRACQKELHRRSKGLQDTKEDLPYTEEIENRKLQEESKQAIDNMFGNPLEQVDSMIEGTKPFLDGMTPSEWINEQTAMSDKDKQYEITGVFEDSQEYTVKQIGTDWEYSSPVYCFIPESLLVEEEEIIKLQIKDMFGDYSVKTSSAIKALEQAGYKIIKE